MQSAFAVRVLVFVTIAVAGGVLGLAIWQARQDAYQDAKRELSLESEIAREHAEKLVDTYRLAVERIIDLLGSRSDQEIEADESDLHVQMKEIVQKLPQTQSAYVIDRNGVPLVSATAMPIRKDVTAADRDFYVALQNPGSPEVHVSGLYMGRLDGRPFFAVSKRRPFKDGQFNGLVNVSAEPEYIAQFYKTLAIPSGDTLSLVRSDGVFLVRLPFEGQHLINVRARMFPSEVSGLPVEGTYRGNSARDEAERIYEFRKLRGYQVYAVAGRKVSTINGAWLQSVYRLLAWGVPVILSLAGFGLFALRRVRQEQEARDVMLAEMEKRSKAEQALRQSERMEAIGRLTGVLVHDFRNVLAVIGSMLHILERRAPDHAQLLEGGRHAVDRGRHLVDRLLAFSRRQELKIEPTDFNRLIIGMKEMLEISLKNGAGSISLKLDLQDSLPLAQADAGQFETALLNLVSNACDAMPDGGTLIITTWHASADAVLGPADRIEVRVSDTGVGIPPSQLVHVGEPFFTTKPPGKGTGLGLSSVYGYVQQCGGTVTIDSSVGRGTTITMSFVRAHVNISKPMSSADILAFPSAKPAAPAAR